MVPILGDRWRELVVTATEVHLWCFMPFYRCAAKVTQLMLKIRKSLK